MLELKLDRVTKQYKEKMAVDHISVSFANGVYGLLGENGAGKTTLLRMICSLLPSGEGEIVCNGIPIQKMGREYRRLLGYLPQEFGYYPEFTPWRYLMYLASLKALPKAMAQERCRELLTHPLPEHYQLPWKKQNCDFVYPYCGRCSLYRRRDSPYEKG